MKYLYMMIAVLSVLAAGLLGMAGLFHQTTGYGWPWGLALPLMGIALAVGWVCVSQVTALETEDEDEEALNRPWL